MQILISFTAAREVNDRSAFKLTVVREEAEERGQSAAPGFWGKNKVVSARCRDAGRTRVLAAHLADRAVVMRVLMQHVSVKYILVLSGKWDLGFAGGHGPASGLRLLAGFGALLL